MPTELTRNHGTLLHNQMSSVLRSGVLSGRYAHGERLPREEALMEMFGVSRATVRRALLTLEIEGLIERRQGKGTRFTYEPDSRASASAKQYFDRLDVPSRQSPAVFHEFGWIAAPADARAALELAPDAQVLRIARTRMRDDQPQRYILTYVPEFSGRAIRQRQLGSGTIIDTLEKVGFPVDRHHVEVGAILADPILAAQLSVRIGTPLIELLRILISADGRRVAFSRTAIVQNRSSARVLLHEGNGSHLVVR